jgi:hypothetical protein
MLDMVHVQGLLQFDVFKSTQNSDSPCQSGDGIPQRNALCVIKAAQTQFTLLGHPKLLGT